MAKYLAVAGYCALFSGLASAALPVYQPTGAAYTLGGTINPRALMTSMANPAAPYLMGNTFLNQNFRVGFIGPVGLGYEMGDVSNLSNQVDSLEGLLGAQYSTTAEAQAAINKANGILRDIGDTAYLKVSASAQVPFMPIIYKTDTRGAFSVDASISALSRADVLSDDIYTVNSPSGVDIKSNSSLYIKAATDFRVGLGYSQRIAHLTSGDLVGGIQANFHRISLGRSLSLLTDTNSNTKDDVIKALTSDKKSSSGVGIDLGAIWVSNHYQLGATLANINEPTFKYSSLGDCAGRSGSALARCSAANSLSGKGKLDLNETYTMEAQGTIDGAITSRDRQWMLSGSYDVNAVKDPVGDQYQWKVASLSYYSDTAWLLGVRVGYRKNIVGTKLSYATAGLTLFRRLNIDVAYGLQKVHDSDGNSKPRSVAISVGWGLAFK